MQYFSQFWMFFGVLVLAQVSPGPDFVLIVRQLVRGGFAAAFASIVGISAGLLLHCTLIYVLFLQLKVLPLQFLQLLSMAACLWLGYLAWRCWPRHKPDSEIETRQQGSMDAAAVADMPDSRSYGGWRCFMRGFVTNLLNPKALMFLFAMLWQFANPAEHGAGWYWLLAATVVFEALLGWSLCSWLLLRFGLSKLGAKANYRIEMLLALLLGLLALAGLWSLFAGAA